MEFSRKEFLVNRIIAGVIKIVPGFFVGLTEAKDKYLAEEVYEETYQEAYNNGGFLEEELYDFLVRHNIWTMEDENNLKECNKDLEKMKIGVLSKSLKYKELEVTKVGIAKVKDAITSLLNKKHSLDFLTCHGFAKIEKAKFLLAASLRDFDGKKVIPDYWDTDSEKLNLFMHKYLEVKLSEEDIRLLARSEPWRGIWAIGKNNNLFGKPIVDYTEEQHALTLWSTFYDNIYEHPEKPPDNIINCDDFLDGWLISQKKKQKVQETEDKVGAKNKSGDIFIPVDSVQAASEIEDLNDPVAAATKRQRLKVIKERGKVHELELPDMKKRLYMAANQKLRRGG